MSKLRFTDYLDSTRKYRKLFNKKKKIQENELKDVENAPRALLKKAIQVFQ